MRAFNIRAMPSKNELAASAANNDIEHLKSLQQTSIELSKQLESLLVDKIPVEKLDSTQQSVRKEKHDLLDAVAQGKDDAFEQAGKSVELVKAHVTKITLFMINEPFSASSISKVVNELMTGPLPSLAHAVQVCETARYTTAVRRSLASGAGRIFSRVRELLNMIPQNGKALQVPQKTQAKAGQAPSLAITGIIWSACDDVKQLCDAGVPGYFIKKATDIRGILEDNLEELKEWGEEPPEETDDNDDDDDDDDGADNVLTDADTEDAAHHDSAQAMIDDLMASPQPIPADDPNHIRERLESCIKRLRLTSILYLSICKRRFEVLPKVPSYRDTVHRLGEMTHILDKIPERYGELTAAFYEHDAALIDKIMDQCYYDAFTLTELLVRPWDELGGHSDKFTEWVYRFQLEIKRPIYHSQVAEGQLQD